MPWTRSLPFCNLFFSLTNLSRYIIAHNLRGLSALKCVTWEPVVLVLTLQSSSRFPSPDLSELRLLIQLTWFLWTCSLAAFRCFGVLQQARSFECRCIPIFLRNCSQTALYPIDFKPLLPAASLTGAATLACRDFAFFSWISLSFAILIRFWSDMLTASEPIFFLQNGHIFLPVFLWHWVRHCRLSNQQITRKYVHMGTAK